MLESLSPWPGNKPRRQVRLIISHDATSWILGGFAVAMFLAVAVICILLVLGVTIAPPKTLRPAPIEERTGRAVDQPNLPVQMTRLRSASGSWHSEVR